MGIMSGNLSLFAQNGFRRYWLARFFVSMGLQIVSVAIGWHLYDLTRDPFYLGLAGLMQFLPVLLLVTITGTVADRFDRRRIFMVSVGVVLLATFLLWYLVATAHASAMMILLVFLGFGLARAFIGPAVQPLLSAIVPPEDLARAIALNSTTWQMATIVGPVLGGLLYDGDPLLPFGIAAGFFILSLTAMARLPYVSIPRQMTETGWKLVLGGFDYVRREKIVLGAMTLDLFAVMLGGVVALMPVFARDILTLGPWGLGVLRAAPGVGGVGMAIYLSLRPIKSHAGIKMLVAVGIFGLSIIAFGLSHHAWLSIIALVVLGASDTISVNIRQTLVQLWTPDALRGRVSAISMLSVGASNELGEFRAGTMASLIGVVPAVVLGGVASVGVALGWGYLFPALRRANHLDGRA